MNKREFIDKLRWFAANNGTGLPDEYGHPNYRPSRGETSLAEMFARWLEDQDISEEPYTNWIRNLPRLIVEAYAEFVIDPRWEPARGAYEIETGHPIPDLVDVYTGGLHRVLVASSVSRLMPLLAGERWLGAAIEATLGAQQSVIDHAWWRFVRVAYRELMSRIKTERHRGNTGTFGATTLMTWACAGRVLFTFEGGSGQVTYVADDSDMYGLRSGANVPGAPYAACVAMIEEVIKNWDIDKMQRSATVGLG